MSSFGCHIQFTNLIYPQAGYINPNCITLKIWVHLILVKQTTMCKLISLKEYIEWELSLRALGARPLMSSFIPPLARIAAVRGSEATVEFGFVQAILTPSLTFDCL